MQAPLAALPGQPDHSSRFVGLTAGTVALDDSFSPANVAAMLGAPAAA